MTVFPVSDRANRLKELTAHLSLQQDLPLLKSVKLDPAGFERLRVAVNNYLYSTLSEHYRDRHIPFAPDVVASYPQALEGLPNVTPNGLVLPKLETYLQYNAIHRCVAHLVRQAGIGKFIERIHVPINIRLVNGRSDPAKDARPRASTKLHSDIWAGEPAEAIMVFFPVLGDPSCAGVRFFEPDGFPEKFLTSLADYSEGAEMGRNAREYQCSFPIGEMLFTDPFLLHYTTRVREGFRLSIDFRFLSRKKLDSDRVVKSRRLPSYVSPEEWHDYGAGRLLTSRASLLKEFNGPDLVKDEYATEFSTTILS